MRTCELCAVFVLGRSMAVEQLCCASTCGLIYQRSGQRGRMCYHCLRSFTIGNALHGSVTQVSEPAFSVFGRDKKCRAVAIQHGRVVDCMYTILFSAIIWGISPVFGAAEHFCPKAGLCVHLLVKISDEHLLNCRIGVQPGVQASQRGAQARSATNTLI